MHKLTRCSENDLYGPDKLIGMTINTMVVKLCIENETATGDWILVLFFETFANWDWFDHKPVISIVPIENWQLTEVSGLKFANLF